MINKFMLLYIKIKNKKIALTPPLPGPKSRMRKEEGSFKCDLYLIEKYSYPYGILGKNSFFLKIS